ncbi:hypothetical protein DAEQUDRAFT_760942 [Daedalea quercina L-15889]|uniref:F-box domain-containing protein n=1 Tax=Daedalea quercina L-15889 TaxID=1314783 RepID=A0A165UIJ8_9APHY|nr:hypothetical protein DAEQUDRAFT_760942 [Daedalea quercina L-15889]
MSSNSATSATILLRPRPLSRTAGSFALLPLLPYRREMIPLPGEVWTKILGYAFDHYNLEMEKPNAKRGGLKRDLLLLSKDLHDVALPLFFAHVVLNSLSALEKFTHHLCLCDKKWDSIRRIPYSTPGRWVQHVDLREIDICLASDLLCADTLLTTLFPLLPFLKRCLLNPSLALSRRATMALGGRYEIAHLRVLKGLRLKCTVHTADDHLAGLVRACVNLEELTIVGTGIDVTDFDAPGEWDSSPSTTPLELPHLRKLVMLSMPYSPLMNALLHARLPALRHLTITPYDPGYVPASLVPQFIHAHGQLLTSLHFFTIKTWPAMLLPSPVDILRTCPNLSHLSLETPLPVLVLKKTDPDHPLHILSISRPNPEFLAVLESLLPKMPALRIVRARDVRWLRPGMSVRAQQAGTQGEMVEWRRRLARRGIQVVDSEWKTGLE